MAVDVGSLTFVADAIIAHLRSGHRPIDEEAVALTRLPMIAELRVRLRPDDEGWLVELMKVRGNHGILGAGLIKKELAKKPNVQDLLRARFDEATGPDGSIRAWLFWKILDDHHLTADWHERLFRYAMDDWDEFKGPLLNHFSRAEDVLPFVLSRIAGPTSHPKSNQWAWLCCLPVASDKTAAKSLILLCYDSLDEFGKRVADELLRKFFNSQRGKAAT